MRIDDIVYFSPNLRIRDLDLTNMSLENKSLVISSFSQRIESYFIKPAKQLVYSRAAFAAGALECLLIDSLARYSTESNVVKTRFTKWCIANLATSESTAGEFYNYFRCGILHESHIKSSGQFSFELNFNNPINEIDGYLIVNPKILLISIETYFYDFISDLNSNDKLFKIFHKRLQQDFGNELNL